MYPSRKTHQYIAIVISKLSAKKDVAVNHAYPSCRKSSRAGRLRTAGAAEDNLGGGSGPGMCGASSLNSNTIDTMASRKWILTSGGHMAHNLEQTIFLLSRTPAALDALLRNLPDAWTQRNEGENTWNAFEVVGHLIHGERTDWMSRARMILEFGETRTFEPFDRGGHEREIREKSLSQLLDEFARVRSENLGQLRAMNLQPAQLELRGQHPAFRAVTLSELLATWAVHDLTHLHQISRIMAHQYREATGPWSKYLGVLQCAGHSASV